MKARVVFNEDEIDESRNSIEVFNNVKTVEKDGKRFVIDFNSNKTLKFPDSEINSIVLRTEVKA